MNDLLVKDLLDDEHGEWRLVPGQPLTAGVLNRPANKTHANFISLFEQPSERHFASWLLLTLSVLDVKKKKIKLCDT